MLIVLVVVGLMAMLFYLFAGHSWNYAATSIDDSVGRMDGYVIVVYEGTIAPEQEEDATTTTSADSSPLASMFPSSSSTSSSSTAQSGGEADGQAQTSVSTTDDTTSTSTDLSSTDDSKQTVSIEDVAKSYQEKGASIFTLRTNDVSLYDEPVIVSKGGKRVGFIAVDETSTAIGIEKQVNYLKNSKVDIIVAVTPDIMSLQGVKGIDIAVCTTDCDLPAAGKTIDDTFFVQAPEQGSVGMVLVSPSNVVSTKTISEL